MLAICNTMSAIYEDNVDEKKCLNIVLFLFPIVVHCKSVQAPSDGQVTPDSCRIHPEYDTTCHFSCPQGYRLYGEPIVTCLSDGQWSGNTTTFCIGWFILCNKKIVKYL